jgi:hypothetical protein
VPQDADLSQELSIGLNDLTSAFNDLEAALARDDADALDRATQALRARITTLQPGPALSDDERRGVLHMELRSEDLAVRIAERLEAYDRLIAQATRKPVGHDPA